MAFADGIVTAPAGQRPRLMQARFRRSIRPPEAILSGWVSLSCGSRYPPKPVSAEGGHEHLRRQSDQDYHKEQANPFVRNGHEETGAQDRANHRSQGNRTGDWSNDIASDKICAREAAAVTEIMKFEVADETLMGRRNAVSMAGTLRTPLPIPKSAEIRPATYIRTMPIGRRATR